MKGILFKPDMNLAIREGRKTVTRRLIEPAINDHPDVFISQYVNPSWCFIRTDTRSILKPKPRYLPGETVYVKEAWATDRIFNKMNAKEIENTKVATVPLWYRINDEQFDQMCQTRGRWRSPLFMPQSAARTFLLIKDVRPERLRCMTDTEALLEGVGPISIVQTATMIYQRLWDEINPKHPWDSNPWVWRIEFEVKK
jgi:hypothetical protein